MTLSGGLVRGALATAGLALTVISQLSSGDARIHGAVTVVLIVLLAVAVVRPGSPALLMLLLLIIGQRIFGSGGVIDANLAVLAALVPLIHQLAAVATGIPARSRLDPAVLVGPSLRYVAVVLPVEVVIIGLVVLR